MRFKQVSQMQQWRQGSSTQEAEDSQHTVQLELQSSLLSLDTSRFDEYNGCKESFLE